MTLRLRAACFCVLVCLLVPALPHAQRQWVEVKSAHFTVATDGSEKNARNIVWQFEQVREVIKALCSWAPDEIPKPVLVLAVRDENGMKTLLPQFARSWNGVNYSSYSVGAPERLYVAMRTDLLGENTQTTNPYQTSFWPYAAAAINAGLSQNLPQWFERGFADFLSNSIVTDAGIQVGMPFQHKLQLLRSEQRLRLAELLAADRRSPWMSVEHLPTFDAEAWAFVHFLLFGDNGVYRPRVDQFVSAILKGMPASAATEVAFKDLDKLEFAFTGYIARPSFPYATLKVNANVKREAFAARPWSAAESAATRALWLVANDRPVEARALVAEARKTEPNSPLAYEVEANLLEEEKNTEGARAAFEKAVDLGSTNYYVHYMFANLTRSNANGNAELLAKIEKALATSTTLNPHFSWSHTLLGEVRIQMGRPQEAIAPLERAVVLERDSARNRVSLGRAYLNVNRREDAQKVAQEALAMASTDVDRRNAQTLIDMIARGPAPARR